MFAINDAQILGKMCQELALVSEGPVFVSGGSLGFRRVEHRHCIPEGEFTITNIDSKHIITNIDSKHIRAYFNSVAAALDAKQLRCAMSTQRRR